MKVQGRRKRGRPKRRWLDRVRDDIKEKGLSRRKCTTVLHGGVCHPTSTPHRSRDKMKRKEGRLVKSPTMAYLLLSCIARIKMKKCQFVVDVLQICRKYMIARILNLLQLVAVLPDRGQHQIVSH